MYQPQLESMDRQALSALQSDRLRQSLASIAASNEGYYQLLGRPSLQSIRALEDLQKLPFLTKPHLRAAYPFGLACADRSQFLRMQMSSGTTGTPVICPYTRADIEQWKEVMARCYVAAGVGPDDVIQITPSFGLPNGGFGFHFGAEAIGAFYVPIGGGRTLLQLQLMKDLGTTAITAIATYPLRLMEVAKEENFDFGQTRLRVGIFGSEMWSDELRSRIEAGMGIDTYDIIGMTETGGVGMGIDCAVKAGIHVWEDHYVVEIIDPDTGQVLEDGQEGEMVITTLTRQALPLVRFRTGDVTRILSRDRCDCGRTHLRVDRFKGRTDDMIVFKGCNFYPSQIEQVLLGYEEVANDYLIELYTDESGSAQMKLTVEVTRELSPDRQDRIQRELHDFLGLSLTPEFMLAGQLPRPPGKAVRVIDKR